MTKTSTKGTIHGTVDDVLETMEKQKREERAAVDRWRVQIDAAHEAAYAASFGDHSHRSGTVSHLRKVGPLAVRHARRLYPRGVGQIPRHRLQELRIRNRLAAMG